MLILQRTAKRSLRLTLPDGGVVIISQTVHPTNGVRRWAIDAPRDIVIDQVPTPDGLITPDDKNTSRAINQARGRQSLESQREALRATSSNPTTTSTRKSRFAI